MTPTPPAPDNRGRRRYLNAIDGRRQSFTVVDEIVREQEVVDRGSRKLIYFQKLQFEGTGRTEYRFTYYMLGVKPGARGRWVFGQYSLMIPVEHLSKLLAEARARGWEGV